RDKSITLEKKNGGFVTFGDTRRFKHNLLSINCSVTMAMKCNLNQQDARLRKHKLERLCSLELEKRTNTMSI
ncbi:hypothetical protein CR513_55783, partial [Mucuna pruriens]